MVENLHSELIEATDLRNMSFLEKVKESYIPDAQRSFSSKGYCSLELLKRSMKPIAFYFSKVGFYALFIVLVVH